MKLMRNREVQRLLLLCLLGTALIAAAGFCAGIVPGVLALAGGLVLSGGVMGVTLRRYRAIAQLNQDIDRVLHGEESLPIVSNDEGELAVLRSEVGKMTIRLREAADSQRRERLHLADAMADISHQLRTPLTALNLTVTLLAAEDITPERRRELMRELRRLLSRMDWLVESLLKMSKLDAGTIPFQRMPLSAAELVRRAAAPLAVPMEVRGEHLETDVGGEMLLCDPGWTVEALGNVLKNCMEHAQSVVRVGALYRDHRARRRAGHGSGRHPAPVRAVLPRQKRESGELWHRPCAQPRDPCRAERHHPRRERPRGRRAVHAAGL